MSLSRFLDKESRYYYDVYELIYWLIDLWEQDRECIILFYVVDFIDFNVILRIFMLTNQAIVIDLQTINWRFKIYIERLKIIKSKQFEQHLEKKHQIYVIICVDVTQTQQETQSDLVLSKEIEEFRNFFNNEKVEMLFE